MKKAYTTLIRNQQEKETLSKTKMYSPPLSKEEIVDVKKTLRSKGKIYKTPEELIRDLHTNVANQQNTTS